jgi:hypothetical protein
MRVSQQVVGNALLFYMEKKGALKPGGPQPEFTPI